MDDVAALAAPDGDDGDVIAVPSAVEADDEDLRGFFTAEDDEYDDDVACVKM